MKKQRRKNTWLKKQNALEAFDKRVARELKLPGGDWPTGAVTKLVNEIKEADNKIAAEFIFDFINNTQALPKVESEDENSVLL